ncbi:hypothetical protein F5884DRAFT_214143 [Xylogone sp. PMI_703]|nr:hypothetical protein F5884DRAFT_214143 [Xylogone sp. PMI_703]
MTTTMNQMNTASLNGPSTYSSIDTMDRHEFGVQKNRKAASTGGGRAWSEDEEVYLLQTRLQKMPYKHIAAHLKKTELACRLHYHQLSHGSNRRKRTNSVGASSNGDSSTQSPILPVSMPSPIHENTDLQQDSPPSFHYSPQSQSSVQLPAASTLMGRSTSSSPPRTLNQPVAILPKPAPPRRSLSESAVTPALRLDCDIAATPAAIPNIDKERLRRIYEAHRSSFWTAIAAEYGGGISPLVLEETWKRGIVANAPPTPCISPDTHIGNGISYQQYSAKPQENKNSATSISALLGIDASPRSPDEREMVRRIEENRDCRDMVMA